MTVADPVRSLENCVTDWDVVGSQFRHIKEAFMEIQEELIPLLNVAGSADIENDSARQRFVNVQTRLIECESIGLRMLKLKHVCTPLNDLTKSDLPSMHQVLFEDAPQHPAAKPNNTLGWEQEYTVVWNDLTRCLNRLQEDCKNSSQNSAVLETTALFKLQNLILRLYRIHLVNIEWLVHLGLERLRRKETQLKQANRTYAAQRGELQWHRNNRSDEENAPSSPLLYSKKTQFHRSSDAATFFEDVLDDVHSIPSLLYAERKPFTRTVTQCVAFKNKTSNAKSQHLVRTANTLQLYNKTKVSRFTRTSNYPLLLLLKKTLVDTYLPYTPLYPQPVLYNVNNIIGLTLNSDCVSAHKDQPKLKEKALVLQQTKPHWKKDSAFETMLLDTETMDTANNVPSTPGQQEAVTKDAVTFFPGEGEQTVANKKPSANSSAKKCAAVSRVVVRQPAFPNTTPRTSLSPRGYLYYHRQVRQQVLSTLDTLNRPQQQPHVEAMRQSNVQLWRKRYKELLYEQQDDEIYLQQLMHLFQQWLCVEQPIDEPPKPDVNSVDVRTQEDKAIDAVSTQKTPLLSAIRTVSVSRNVTVVADRKCYRCLPFRRKR